MKTRQSYWSDFKQNEKGRYSYQGVWYSYRYRQMNRRQLLAGLWALCVIMLGAAIAAGCLPPGSMPATYVSAAFVLFMYMASLISGISVFWSLGRLSAGRTRIRRYVYETSLRKIPFRSGMAAGFSGMAVLGQAVYLGIHGLGRISSGGALFLVLELIALAAALGIQRITSQMEWSLC